MHFLERMPCCPPIERPFASRVFPFFSSFFLQRYQGRFLPPLVSLSCRDEAEPRELEYLSPHNKVCSLD